MNNTLCSAAFSHLYSTNEDQYRLCCFQGKSGTLPYRPSEVPPFKHFDSPEMNQIRSDMLVGKHINGCEVCYDLEANDLHSYRQKHFRSTLDQFTNKVDLKLRMFGSICNLSCYMCYPYNSSKKRGELSKMSDADNIFVGHEDEIDLGTVAYQQAVDDIVANIDRVKSIRFVGGEPFLMPRHWDFVFALPKNSRKKIHLKYNTNLTKTSFKNYNLEDIIAEYPKLTLTVSADHYGEKHKWIRYPIDVDQFEDNLVKYKKHIMCITLCVSLLNAEDIIDITNYYKRNFGIEVVVLGGVREDPLHLAARQLDPQLKAKLIAEYQKYGNQFIGAINALSFEADESLREKTARYFRALDKMRGTDVNRIFGKKLYD